ncbi:dubious [Schizosaccharomyces pombe]|uniref:Putative uncharacterized transmembrane protein C16E9.20 n=1 Tax=Schizosaccharomyces pombe (strain 972 / ATCC 24843) TaxID=284812 RepID=YB7K_SCHPO|nr:uncharacterized protein SPBC16E9.20 [Schizosaccharomyces pombe]G2TRQ3.1 RecName: Full=Putative uncharacterized transmembrane protein C16E9.20 [Schizosaccharomyces pombe 972h-]CCD31366.1 dubious [Schizosaccharomyces pombe]|eukprot:NP_001343156.1 uncharacterized protein SPBC16E9.20 [Schizosaccharomyces pombe]
MLVVVSLTPPVGVCVGLFHHLLSLGGGITTCITSMETGITKWSGSLRCNSQMQKEKGERKGKEEERKRGKEEKIWFHSKKMKIHDYCIVLYCILFYFYFVLILFYFIALYFILHPFYSTILFFFPLFIKCSHLHTLTSFYSLLSSLFSSLIPKHSLHLAPLRKLNLSHFVSPLCAMFPHVGLRLLQTTQ